MKSTLPAAFAFAVISASSAAFAQAEAPDHAGMEAQQHRIIGFLSKAEQDRVVAAYNKAVANDPGLKAAQGELQRGRQGMENASDADRQAFMAKVKDYQTKLRGDMIKEDSTLGPVLDKIDAHRAEMQAQGGGPGQ